MARGTVLQMVEVAPKNFKKNLGYHWKCTLYTGKRCYYHLLFGYYLITKLLQKSGIRKNEVIELIYRGFI